ncbi:MAG: eCIS core domain-containing protein [Kofleriaceae bacterium]
MGADAYTVDRNIVVAPGVDLDSSAGRQLLAHEIAHAASTGTQDGKVRRKVTGYEGTQSFGDAFARGLTDAELEQMIEYLIGRRGRVGTGTIDYEATVANLEVMTRESSRRGQRISALDRDAVHTLMRDVSTAGKELVSVLRQIASNRDGLQSHPITASFIDHAHSRLNWSMDALYACQRYLDLSMMPVGAFTAALISMAATRAQAAWLGVAILRSWCALLQLSDQIASLQLLQLEHRYRVLHSQQAVVDGVFAQLSNFDPDKIAAAAAILPTSTTELATAFKSLLDDTERAETVQKWAMRIQAGAELATLAVGLRNMFASRGPPSALSLSIPAIAGVTPGGAAAMGQIVISAEWVAAIRHLVEIGAISAASAAAAYRARGFPLAMAQATDLPQPVKDLLGDGPTTDAMKVTNTTGAGLARAPRHHVLPQEKRAFFEERGFKGDLDIDNFTVELERAHHEAIHGGGSWVEGRKWPGEWNALVMSRLQEREVLLGRQLTVSEVLKHVEALMRQRKIPLRFVPYRGP